MPISVVAIFGEERFGRVPLPESITTLPDNLLTQRWGLKRWQAKVLSLGDYLFSFLALLADQIVQWVVRLPGQRTGTGPASAASKSGTHGCPPRANTSARTLACIIALAFRGTKRSSREFSGSIYIRWNHFTFINGRNESESPETCTTGRITDWRFLTIEQYLLDSESGGQVSSNRNNTATGKRAIQGGGKVRFAELCRGLR